MIINRHLYLQYAGQQDNKECGIVVTTELIASNGMMSHTRNSKEPSIFLFQPCDSVSQRYDIDIWPIQWQSARQVFFPLLIPEKPEKCFFCYSSQVEELGLNQLLARHCGFPDKKFVLYGDRGFALSSQIITPFRRGRNFTPAESAWNEDMSRFRICVEWGIGRIKTLFQLLEKKVSRI